MPFSEDFRSYILTIRKQVEGEKRGRLESVIRDCVNEREEAGKGVNG